MGYAYDHDCPFEAFITNLGKYNEGALVGEWVKFPTTAEELQKVFERIGIGSKDDFGHPYEEWFITDYDCYVDGLYEMLGEYENLDELNYLASKLEELDDHDYEHFQAAMQVSDYTGSVKDLINLIDNLDKYEIYPGVDDYSDLGRYYIDEVGVMEIPEHLANYIDYEAYGRDVAIDEMGHLIGCLDGLLPYAKEIERCGTSGEMFHALGYCNKHYLQSLKLVKERLQPSEEMILPDDTDGEESSSEDTEEVETDHDFTE